MKTTHQATVVPIVIEPHPNADKLGIVRVDGCIVCVNKEMWAGKDRGVYIPPQNLVDTDRPEFSFLKKGDNQWVEVKPTKLRGVYSDGLLIPCDQGLSIGTDLTDELGLIHADHEPKNDFAACGEKHSFSDVGKYDVDGPRNFACYFEGLDVIATEKIHGENCGFGYIDGKLRVRSRSNWLKEVGHFWHTTSTNDNLVALVKAYPDHVIYGEVCGLAAKGGIKFNYGLPEYQKRKFIAFDIRRPDRTFINQEEVISICKQFGVEFAPVVYSGKYSPDIFSFASGKSLLGNHIKEGIVVRPTIECQTPTFERMIFKVVNPEYSAL